MAMTDHAPRFVNRADQKLWFERIPAPWWALAVVLLFLPVVANNFWLFQVMGWTFILGMIGLSLMFLAGYGGMVSLLQMTVAGVAGYMVAILGTSGTVSVSLGLSWWIVLPAAFLIAALFATLSGALAVRTEGIYTIMITLAIAAAFFYFTRQNYTIFNGYSGFNLVLPPQVFGVNWRDPLPFYYLSLALAALSYGAVVYIARSPFGLALQGVRDNPRRMAALGFNVTAHRVAAYALASVFASTGASCWSGRMRRSPRAQSAFPRRSISWSWRWSGACGARSGRSSGPSSMSSCKSSRRISWASSASRPKGSS